MRLARRPPNEPEAACPELAEGKRRSKPGAYMINGENEYKGEESYEF